MKRFTLILLLFLAGCGGSVAPVGVTGRDAIISHVMGMGFSKHADATVYGVRIIECRKQEGDITLSLDATDAFTMIYVSLAADEIDSPSQIERAFRSAERIVDSLVGAPITPTLYAPENQVPVEGGVPRTSYETTFAGRNITATRYLSVPEGATDVRLATFTLSTN